MPSAATTPAHLPDADVLVLQHIACEPPGVYEDVMLEHGARIHRVELDEGERPPDPREFHAVVVMGGPMGAYEDELHPWLAGEKRLLRRAVESGVPVFGACLGAQLLAASLGARVFRAPTPEVGVLPVALTADGRADPVTARLPAAFPTLQWHSDTFDLPAGATLLASSPAYANQAFRVGATVYAVQFHLEVTHAMAEEWAAVPAYADALDAVLGPGALDGLLADFAADSAAIQDHARTLFGAWWDTAMQHHRPASATAG
jgi:GMP synthase-like glutamine amidotransferase